MLVSSFGYLNKGANTINGIRIENNKQQKPIVNQGLVFDAPAECKQTADKTKKTEGFIARCLNVIA